MISLKLPYVNLPQEFVSLLKTNLAVTTASDDIFEVIRPNRALYTILEKAFKEFDDGRGVERVLMALGWANFRDRMASIYIYKKIFGDFPTKTNMDLVEDIKDIESTFSNHSVNSFSRLFLLGFYLKMANLEIQSKGSQSSNELKIPQELGTILKMSHGRSERIDWLILILMHLNESLGESVLIKSLKNGVKFDELYHFLPKETQERMNQNLLAYGASIQEADVFLYERV